MKKADGPSDSGRKTNQGEVELTAEMVVRGMVFAPKDPRDYALGEGRVFVVGRRNDANGIWRDARNENLGTNLLGADRLLGCDPEVATRRDCEQYGIAPFVDAGAHGFARVRGGGVVDLRRSSAVIPLGAVVDLVGGRRATIGPGKANPEDVERFIGLDVRLARPEDVTRFTCRAKGVSGHTPDGGPVYSWCSLAYGEHPEHEDLATGAKWPASRSDPIHVDRAVSASVSTGLAAWKASIFPGATVEGAVEQTLARNEAALCRIEERLHALIDSIPANGGSLAVEMVMMDLLELRAILLGAAIDKRPEDPASVLGGLLRERFRVSTRAASSFFAETPEGWGRFSEFLREWVRRERERVPGPEGEGR
jgi:hypothetical protein